jgi:F0F1-type ATP synthase assembly protein I
MSQPPAEDPDVPDAVRAQILATEHWSLLATRSLTWSESFSRSSWFLTVVSGGVVALALVAQATDFGREFQVFALLLMPVLVVIGLMTFIRLMHVNHEDVALVAAMNRLRHGYLDIAPGLERYFATGHHDDAAGILRTYGRARRRPLSQYASSTPILVGLIDAVLVGAVAGLACDALDAPLGVSVVVAIVAAVATLAVLLIVMVRNTEHAWTDQAEFPS